MTAALDTRPVRMDALAEELGFSTTQALKKWLQRRELPYWLDGGDLWTDRAAVEAHIASTRDAERSTKRPRPRALDTKDETKSAAQAIMKRG